MILLATVSGVGAKRASIVCVIGTAHDRTNQWSCLGGSPVNDRGQPASTGQFLPSFGAVDTAAMSTGVCPVVGLQ